MQALARGRLEGQSIDPTALRRRSRSCHAAVALAAFAVNVRRQQRQRGRRNSIDPAGMADRAWSMHLQLMPHFVGKSGQVRIVEIVAENEAFVAALGADRPTVITVPIQPEIRPLAA